ncbi:MAG TPA: hypothetical protein DCQ06_10910 [Myxococcales bacterium]|nr:hypothetical protein [Myxococcales bacterium]HAN32097.1 hypothetical protein [Myxococcales bacterium]
MPIDDAIQSLLEIVACPVDHQPLRVASPALLSRLNEAITQRCLRQHDGRLVDQACDQLLVSADGARAYPVRAGVAELLCGSAISLDEQDRAYLTD